MLARPSTQTRFSSVRCSAKKSGDAKASWAKKLAEPAPTGFNVDSSKKSAKKVVEEEEPAMPITDFKVRPFKPHNASRFCKRSVDL